MANTHAHSIENKSYIKAMREIRRSNAAGLHADKRTRRARTRSASLTRAMRDYN
jgi:hypothetical protein